MLKRSRVLICLLAAIALAFGWYLLAARHTPAGQPPLTTVQQESIAALRADFNQHADKVRIIVLLSPT
jgi:hypothetical protein